MLKYVHDQIPLLELKFLPKTMVIDTIYLASEPRDLDLSLIYLHLKYCADQDVVVKSIGCGDLNQN